MAVYIDNNNVNTLRTDSSIGANSVDTTSGRCFISISGNTIIKATSSTAIDGTAQTQKAFASDNATVAKDKLEYIGKQTDVTYRVNITGGTITAADEGKYYTLSDSVTVDGTTESTSSGQLRMVKFISSTLATFRIV